MGFLSFNRRMPSSNWALCLASWMTSAWPCVTHTSRGSPAIRQTGCRTGRQTGCCHGPASTGGSPPSSKTSWWGILIGRWYHKSSTKLLLQITSLLTLNSSICFYVIWNILKLIFERIMFFLHLFFVTWKLYSALDCSWIFFSSSLGSP